MPVIVKGTYFDKKPPVVCVPVCETSFAETIDTISKLVDKGVAMLEWRADYFEELSIYVAERLHFALDLEESKRFLYKI